MRNFKNYDIWIDGIEMTDVIYDFYERVYNEVFLKDMRNMCMYPVREILTDDYFIRIHCENKKKNMIR